ncbi:MAG: hypothetical protein CMJ31_07430 [Phycisphaerae bacterium]|nr:hypothetical protein [Phycisphaerae bacterium]
MLPPTVQLQPGETERFAETQRLVDNHLVRVLLPLETLVVTGVLIAVGASAPPSKQATLAVVWFLVAIVMPALLFTIGVRSVVTDRRLIVKWWPPLPGRDLRLDEIISATPITYQPISGAGGWGWRISPKYHRAFNMSGDQGVLIRTGDGHRDQFLLGSKRTPELAAAIGKENEPRPSGSA